MFDQGIRDPGELVSDEKTLAAARKLSEQRRAKSKKDGRVNNTPPNLTGRPKSIVNRVTEYGALFNRLNEERLSRGLAPLKTAMEVLIEAMQSEEIELKDKSKIAEKLATFESSRAPIISIEHVQNSMKEEEKSADESLSDFLESLKKV